MFSLSPPPRNFREYVEYVRHRIQQAQPYTPQWIDVKTTQRDGMNGLLSIPPFQFQDGATLELYEDITVVGNRTITRNLYAYKYQRAENGTSFYFRYECDPDNVRPFVHPEHHLHANREEPRYIMHATNFDEIFDFILHNFYYGH